MARRGTEQLAVVRQRLNLWRERHGGRGKPIPPELWEAATAVAVVEGVGVTARALRVDRASLSRRVLESSVVKAPLRGASPQATFVELPSLQSSHQRHLVVRLTGQDGEQMEVLGGIDVLELVREFWSRARCSN